MRQHYFIRFWHGKITDLLSFFRLSKSLTRSLDNGFSGYFLGCSTRTSFTPYSQPMFSGSLTQSLASFFLVKLFYVEFGKKILFCFLFKSFWVKLRTAVNRAVCSFKNTLLSILTRCLTANVHCTLFRQMLKNYEKSKRLIGKNDTRRIMNLYQQLQILHKYFHCVFCAVIIPAVKVMMMSVVIFCSYGVIRTRSLFLLLCVVVNLVTELLMLTAFAGFDTESRKIIQLLKLPKFYNAMTDYEKRVFRALFPIRIKINSLYVVDSPCVVTVMRIVIDYTITLLLA